MSVAPTGMNCKFDFSGQTVLITGGTRGIGRGIAESFLQAGAKVILTYRSNEETADAFREANQAHKDQWTLHRFDASDYSQVEIFFKSLDADKTCIDALIHCAGVRKDAATAMMSAEDWRLVLNTNLDGSFYMCKFAVLNMLQKRYGRIVLITSPASHFGFSGQGNYSASKAGQIGLMRSLSKEVAKRGITVNCCSPGFVETDFLADLNDKYRAEYQKMIPGGRFGTVDEISPAVLFLASRESGYVNGTTLEVTGGL